MTVLYLSTVLLKIVFERLMSSMSHELYRCLETPGLLHFQGGFVVAFSPFLSVLFGDMAPL